MNKLIYIFSFLFFITNLAAQERYFVLKGNVSDADSPLAGAVIVYVSDGKEGTEYAISDKDGNFALKIHKRPSQMDSVKVSMLGYATAFLPIDESGYLNIQLKPQAISLNEVVVRTPKVRVSRDTVKFNVQSFAELQDKSIADVLKRMPGIEVRKDGSIYYNGESINNLYIEGLNLLDGKYSLLTENLPARDVSRVEVIERHQPIRALAEVSTPSKPAINLALKEESKGKWIGNAELAGGLTYRPELLWDTNLFLMRVGRKWNSLNNVKTNNSGKDLTKELLNKSGNKYPDRYDNFISIGTSNAPLDEQRVRFNASALGNTSNLLKLKNEWTIKASFSYLFDKLESWNESSTTYYFNDDIQTVNESDEAKTDKHRLQASIVAEANKKNYYFQNVLSADGEFAKAAQIKGGQFLNTQNASLPHFLVNDALKYIKRNGNRAFTVESYNYLSSFNHELVVLRTGEDAQRQTVSALNYFSNTSVSSDFIVSGGMSIGVSAGLEAAIQSMESILEGVEFLDGTGLLSNSCISAYVRPYISPKLEYNSRRWELRLAIPSGWSQYRGIDAGHFTYRASGSVKYSPLPKFSVEVLGHSFSNGPDIHNAYPGYVMQNYRYIKKGAPSDAQNRDFSLTGHLNFKDPVNMLYVDGIVRRHWNVLQTSVTQDFIEEYIVVGTEYVPSRGDSWYASLGGSVGIYGINGKIGATVYYRDYSSTSIQNGVSTPYLSQTISFIPTFSGRLANWLGMEYKLHYSHNILRLPEKGTHSEKNSLSHTLSLNMAPIRNVDLKISAEHYYTTLTSGQSKNTVLFDASLAYHFNNGVDISIVARNLLNQQNYAYSVYNGLQEYSCMYRIRPCNILAGASFNF